MKKLLATAVIMAATVFGTTSCSTDDRIQIGILQYATHGALDLAREGFIEVLAENDYGSDKVKISVKNPEADNSIMNSMATQLVRKSDLILTIATPATLSVKSAAQTANKNTPILFTAVTDPVLGGIMTDADHPDGNITGTNDMNPIKQQIELIKELKPTATKIGIIHTLGETNSEVQVEIAKRECAALGIVVEVKNFQLTAEIQSVASSLLSSGIDALYLPTDNNVAKAMPTIRAEAKKNQVPVITGEISMVESGGLMTYGLDYKELGRQTGKMALAILNEEKAIADIPCTSLEDFPLVINDFIAKEIGIEIPDSLTAKADRIITTEPGK